MVTSGHVTKTTVTPLDLPWPKTPKKLHDFIFYRTRIIADRIRNLALFCSCDLDLMTFIHEHEMYLLKIYYKPKMNFLSQGFRKLYYRYTYI